MGWLSSCLWQAFFAVFIYQILNRPLPFAWSWKHKDDWQPLPWAPLRLVGQTTRRENKRQQVQCQGSQGFMRTLRRDNALGWGEEWVERSQEVLPGRNDANYNKWDLRHSAGQNAGLHYQEVNELTKGPYCGGWGPTADHTIPQLVLRHGCTMLCFQTAFTTTWGVFFSSPMPRSRNTCHSTFLVHRVYAVNTVKPVSGWGKILHIGHVALPQLAFAVECVPKTEEDATGVRQPQTSKNCYY